MASRFQQWEQRPITLDQAKNQYTAFIDFLTEAFELLPDGVRFNYAESFFTNGKWVNRTQEQGHGRTSLLPFNLTWEEIGKVFEMGIGLSKEKKGFIGEIFQWQNQTPQNVNPFSSLQFAFIFGTGLNNGRLNKILTDRSHDFGTSPFQEHLQTCSQCQTLLKKAEDNDHKRFLKWDMPLASRSVAAAQPAPLPAAIPRPATAIPTPSQPVPQPAALPAELRRPPSAPTAPHAPHSAPVAPRPAAIPMPSQPVPQPAQPQTPAFVHHYSFRVQPPENPIKTADIMHFGPRLKKPASRRTSSTEGIANGPSTVKPAQPARDRRVGPDTEPQAPVPSSKAGALPESKIDRPRRSEKYFRMSIRKRDRNGNFEIIQVSNKQKAIEELRKVLAQIKLIKPLTEQKTEEISKLEALIERLLGHKEPKRREKFHLSLRSRKPTSLNHS